MWPACAIMARQMSEFENREIARVATVEFWHEGCLVGGHGDPLFLEMTDGTRWVVSFNDDPERWELVPFCGEFPVIGRREGDAEMMWKDVEPSVDGTLIGRRVVSFEASPTGAIAVGVLRFEDGAALEFTRNCRAEVSACSFKR